jgi:hypothetical protein
LTLRAHESPDYYRTTIALLKADLERERASHSRTHDAAEVEIYALHAQLARREAELEACTIHSSAEHRNLLAQSGELKHTKVSAPQVLSAMENEAIGARTPQISASYHTREEALRSLDLTTVKNKTFEADIQHIASCVSYSSHHMTWVNIDLRLGP